MSRLAAYAAGNKVYGNGRSNPTSGTVDPSGYVERGVKKKESDRRSGLAAAAGRRLQNNSGVQPESPGASMPGAGGNAQAPFAPISLPDGRMVFANQTGQYEWVPAGIPEGGM